MEDTIECYKILGIEPGASAERVKRAYTELSTTWDPNRHIENPLLRAEVIKKRKEIDDAYESIRFFLPELHDPGIKHTKERLVRDYNELSVEAPVERTRMLLGILAAVVLVGVFLLAYRLYNEGRHAAPASSVEVEQ